MQTIRHLLADGWLEQIKLFYGTSKLSLPQVISDGYFKACYLCGNQYLKGCNKHRGGE